MLPRTRNLKIALGAKFSRWPCTFHVVCWLPNANLVCSRIWASYKNLHFFLLSTQIFAYNQTEVPQVRDLGFAVGPGQHALVGVTVSQVFIKFIINVEIISKRSDWIENL